MAKQIKFKCPECDCDRLCYIEIKRGEVELEHSINVGCIENQIRESVDTEYYCYDCKAILRMESGKQAGDCIDLDYWLMENGLLAKSCDWCNWQDEANRYPPEEGPYHCDLCCGDKDQWESKI